METHTTYRVSPGCQQQWRGTCSSVGGPGCEGDGCAGTATAGRHGLPSPHAHTPAVLPYFSGAYAHANLATEPGSVLQHCEAFSCVVWPGGWGGGGGGGGVM